MSESCENCRYRRASFCQRYAPRPVYVHSDAGANAEWPHITSMDWCGEWQQSYEDAKTPAKPECSHAYDKSGLYDRDRKIGFRIYCNQCGDEIRRGPLGEWVSA